MTSASPMAARIRTTSKRTTVPCDACGSETFIERHQIWRVESFVMDQRLACEAALDGYAIWCGFR